LPSRLALVADDVQLTVIIATTGRPTLPAAIQSATSQMLPGDELVIVFDDSGDAGDSPRNRVIGEAHGTHIAFLDDDDEFLPGALETFRRFARANPGRIGIFRIKYGLYGTPWREDAKELIATATAMYLIPNVRGRVGRFGRSPGAPPGRLGDFAFIVETVAMQGEPVWCTDVVQEIRPEKRALRRLRYHLKLRTRLRTALGIRPPQAPIRRYPEAERWAEDRMRELRDDL
jgi:glycosyltransferase involved in cell wall biosynthesis